MPHFGSRDLLLWVRGGARVGTRFASSIRLLSRRTAIVGIVIATAAVAGLAGSRGSASADVPCSIVPPPPGPGETEVFFEDFCAFNPADWTLGANSSWDAAAQNFVLTPNEMMNSGRLFYNPPVNAEAFRAEFDYQASGGTGADGVVFGIVPDPNYPYGNGGTIDFCPGAGAFGVEFDTFQSTTEGWTDPVEDHIGVVAGCTNTHLATVPAVTRGAHHVRIDFDRGRVLVQFDGTQVMDYTISGYVAASKYFGWSAATGGLTDKHVLDNVHLTLTTPASPMHGDADCSTAINSVDALVALRHSAGLTNTASLACVMQGDTDCNGFINAIDALRLLRYSVELPVSYPEGCPAIGS